MLQDLESTFSSHTSLEFAGDFVALDFEEINTEHLSPEYGKIDSQRASRIKNAGRADSEPVRIECSAA